MACNCAVAVREGNTVLGIDACDYFNNPRSDPTPYMLQYSATKEFGAAIYRSRAGNLFAVSNLLFESAWCSFLPPVYVVLGKVMFSVCFSVHRGVPPGPVWEVYDLVLSHLVLFSGSYPTPR